MDPARAAGLLQYHRLNRFARRLIALAAALTLLSLLGASGARAETVTKTLEITAANYTWVNTGVELSAGATASVTVTGNGTCHVGGAVDCPFGPVGAGYLCSQNPIVGPAPPGPAGADVPYGAMAGKIGEGGTPFDIGAGKTVSGPGVLYMVYNDCNAPLGYGDNAGSFQVTITYEVATPAPTVAIEKFKVTSSTLDVKVKTSAGGTVTITDAALRKTVVTLASGIHTVKVPFSRSGRRDLAHHTKIKVSVSLTVGTATASTSEKVRL
jgi:hypothetical protein